MNILSWILFGLITGIVAYVIDSSTNKEELINSILLGIVGALAGGIVANFIITLSTTFNSIAFLVASISSLLLLFFGKSLRKT